MAPGLAALKRIQHEATCRSQSMWTLRSRHLAYLAARAPGPARRCSRRAGRGAQRRGPHGVRVHAHAVFAEHVHVLVSYSPNVALPPVVPYAQAETARR